MLMINLLEMDIEMKVVFALCWLGFQAGAAFNSASGVLGDALSLATAGASSTFMVKVIYLHLNTLLCNCVVVDIRPNQQVH